MSILYSAGRSLETALWVEGCVEEAEDENDIMEDGDGGSKRAKVQQVLSG